MSNAELEEVPTKCISVEFTNFWKLKYSILGLLITVVLKNFNIKQKYKDFSIFNTSPIPFQIDD